MNSVKKINLMLIRNQNCMLQIIKRRIENKIFSVEYSFLRAKYIFSASLKWESKERIGNMDIQNYGMASV